MILDYLNMFSQSQAVTVTAASADVIDLGPLYAGNDVRDIGPGYPIEFLAQVATTATAAGAATVTISLQTSKTSDFATATTLLQTGAIAVADLKAGYRYVATVPHGVQRYLRVNYAVATGPLTAGAFTSGLLLDADAQRSYASAFKITV
ncbi:Bbp16 family capsid cement protein [Serratia fonticola]|uniref:Bbp16 family capsid cement protein n=1 Tax=Serratia fonticola TaxID=47917 RepID=UPI003AAA20CC